MLCGRGGIGRRAGFKIPFLWSVGSIPTSRTKDFSEILLFPRSGLRLGASTYLSCAGACEPYKHDGDNRRNGLNKQNMLRDRKSAENTRDRYTD